MRVGNDCYTCVASCMCMQVLKVMAKKLVRKALEMIRKLASEEVEDEEVRLRNISLSDWRGHNISATLGWNL